MDSEGLLTQETKLAPGRGFLKAKLLPLLIVLGLLTVLVRAGALAAFPGGLEEDRDLYRRLAESLFFEGTFALGGHPTAFRPPGYPLLLVPCVAAGRHSWWAIATLHLVLGLGTVFLSFAVGSTLGGLRAGFLAGILVALDPILVWQSTQVMSETAAVFFVAVTLFCGIQAAKHGHPAWVFLTGIAAGITTLTRANLLPWSLLVPPVLVLVRLNKRTGGIGEELHSKPSPNKPQRLKDIFRAHPRRATRKGPLREIIKTILIGYAGVATLLFPWALRNRLLLGHWILGTTHGGITLYLGNNDSFYDHLLEGKVLREWTSDAFVQAWEERVKKYTELNEAQRDRLAYNLATETIARRPREFWQALLWRVIWLWSPFPSWELGKSVTGGFLAIWAVGLFYIFQFGLAIWGIGIALWKRQTGKAIAWIVLAGGALGLILTAVHALYWSNVRMRAPVVPLLACFSALPLAQLGSGSPAQGQPQPKHLK